MRFRAKELQFLSAWAREEKAVDPYILPAHRLQAAHHVRGIDLIRAIKAWAGTEGRRDEDILSLYADPNPGWPWSTPKLAPGNAAGCRKLTLRILVSQPAIAAAIITDSCARHDGRVETKASVAVAR
jgi:hypothetical protein